MSSCFKDTKWKLSSLRTCLTKTIFQPQLAAFPSIETPVLNMYMNRLAKLLQDSILVPWSRDGMWYVNHTWTNDRLGIIRKAMMVSFICAIIRVSSALTTIFQSGYLDFGPGGKSCPNCSWWNANIYWHKYLYFIYWIKNIENPYPIDSNLWINI